MRSDHHAPARLGVALGLALLLAAALEPPASASVEVPRTVRIGVIVSENSEPVHQAIEGFRTLLEAQLPTSRFETYQLDGDPTRAEAPLRRAREGEFDLLLTIGSTATRAATRSAIETPVVACLVLKPAQAWAKAGALYALERDYHDIGAQCGEQAAKALEGQSPSSLVPTNPRKVGYWVNLKTARHMKIHLTPDLVKGARDVLE